MFWERERQETDDFVTKKIYGCERKILCRNLIFQEITSNFFKNFKNSLHKLAFQNIQRISYFFPNKIFKGDKR